MAENIKVIIRERRAQVEGGPVIICGNSGYSITFDFDSDWTRVGARTARFVYTKDGQVQHEDVIFTGDTVAVPVLSEVAYVDVGVFEGDICTTTPARISCKRSILCGSGEIHEPTPDVYAQLMALLNQIAELGAGGATDAQVRQIEANTAGVEANRASIEANAASLGANRADIEENAADIEKLMTGTTPAGNAAKFGGQAPSYYAKATNLANYLPLDGSGITINPVKDLNTFYSGVGLFSSATNGPSGSSWWFVISAGQSGTTTQLAFDLFGNAPNKRRSCAGGTWNDEWSDWDYLPLGGGKINGILILDSGSTSAELHIKRVTSAGVNVETLQWIDRDSPIHHIRVRNADTKKYATYNFGERGLSFDPVDTTRECDFLHAGNYTEYAVSKTGGGALQYLDFVHEGYETQDYTTRIYETLPGVFAFRNGANPGNILRFDTNNISGVQDALHTGNSAKVGVKATAPDADVWIW